MPTENLHLSDIEVAPDGRVGIIKCKAPDCPYWYYGPQTIASAERCFKEHADQYLPGRAPSIQVDWEPVAYCSVCEDGIGDIVVEDGESIRCKDCGTTWDMQGNGGERREE